MNPVPGEVVFILIGAIVVLFAIFLPEVSSLKTKLAQKEDALQKFYVELRDKDAHKTSLEEKLQIVVKDKRDLIEKLEVATKNIEEIATKLKEQRIEFEVNLDQGYEEAYKLLLAEREKVINAENELESVKTALNISTNELNTVRNILNDTKGNASLSLSVLDKRLIEEETKTKNLENDLANLQNAYVKSIDDYNWIVNFFGTAGQHAASEHKLSTQNLEPKMPPASIFDRWV